MRALTRLLQDYLATRRAMGFELYRPGKALENFVRFAEQEGERTITTKLALRWAKRPTDAQPATLALRLGLVRKFACYCRAFEPRTEIPPQGLLPYRYQRKPPYIYKFEEIRRILRATKTLYSKNGLRPLTIETLLGLIAATGLRISEALALDDPDVDSHDGVLTIRNTKFGKTRYTPIHRSTSKALDRYRRRRDQVVPLRETVAFFVSEHGGRLRDSAVHVAFYRLLRELRIDDVQGRRRPRIHDLRHTFAVRTLLRWYRLGLDVDAYLPRLSTYLGHVHVSDTYWYISAVPELLRLAANRAEQADWSCCP